MQEQQFDKNGDLVPIKATTIDLSEQLKELERFKLREQVTSQNMRSRVLSQSNGHLP